MVFVSTALHVATIAIKAMVAEAMKCLTSNVTGATVPTIYARTVAYHEEVKKSPSQKEV